MLRVIDVAETSAREPYLVTAPLTGRPLDGVLAVRGALALEEAIEVTVSLGEALAHAHTLGITHAGLCASSVLLAHPTPPENGAPSELGAKLLDFGIDPGPTSVVAGPLAAMGYASPERLKGDEAAPSDDVHALGALFFEMLTGNLPAEGSLTSSPGLPEPILEVVLRALAPRASRFESCDALVRALKDATATHALPASVPPPRRRAHARAGYVTPVRIRLPNGLAVDGRTEDVSEGGLLMLTTAEVAADESVLVRFALPMSGRLVSVPAETRWARETRGEARAIGLRFLDPGDKVLEDVRAYVALLGDEHRV